MKQLIAIQSELKAPKNQKNNFGNYNYRSCEDILEAVKPLLLAQGCVLTISDDMVEVGQRIYVKATATIKCGDVQESVTAFARESETKKGMDDSQITGSSSSYARKYALNGLFLIDDTKDADTMDNTKQEKKQDADEKPRYNEDNHEKMKQAIVKGEINFASGDEAVKKIREKYKLSTKMEAIVLSLRSK